MSTAADHSSGAGEGKAAFYSLTAMLLFAPLIWGANLPLPLLVLELAAVGLLVHVAYKPAFRDQLPLPLQWSLLIVLLLPLLHLIPVPDGLWSQLPGRAPYAQALQGLAELEPLAPRPISLVPWATERAGLALLPPAMVFLAAVGMPSERLQQLALLFLGIATFQATLGLIQYGDVSDSPFRLGNPHMDGNAFGTYINRNHLAGLLEMALPIGLALLTATIGQSTRPAGHRSRRRTWRQRLAELTTLRVNVAFVYSAASLMILLGLVFTRSRMGIAMAMLGISLCMIAFSRRLGGWNVYGLLGTVTAIAIGVATLIGLTPVLTRFADDPLADSRWSMASAALQAVGEFFPLGSGSGTFTQVFWRFYPPEIAFDGLIDRAHNDYLEWMVEGGMVAIAVLTVFLFCYLRHWPTVWRRGIWSPFRFIQVGAGIGVFVMGVHSFVDFNLHIPANAVFFAFLAALFLHRHPVEPAQYLPGHRRARQLRRSAEHRAAEPAVESRQRIIPPENQINPFNE